MVALPATLSRVVLYYGGTAHPATNYFVLAVPPCREKRLLVQKRINRSKRADMHVTQKNEKKSRSKRISEIWKRTRNGVLHVI